MRGLLAFAVLARLASAGVAGDMARAIRENGFDSAECYRVRDLTLPKRTCASISRTVT